MNRKGFTLVELLVVLLLFSLVLAIGQPVFSASLKYAKGRGAIRQLVNDIRYAQQMAIGTGENHYLVFDREQELYLLKVINYPLPEVLKVVRLEDKLDILGTNFPEDSLHFTPLGSPSRGGTITLRDKRDKLYTITILPATGRVKVYD
ncbi:MAG: prepilin-type N-terminal cleavage/methylation domain-containing protein [Clostridia bacterium]|nr:prepilin-type N-terminal cleavage/methylation domain-containing protein [Clostridia bacterium]